MKALVFAAGLGTRLKPYTNDRTRAVVEIKGRPVVEWVWRRLRVAGMKEEVVKVDGFGGLR